VYGYRFSDSLREVTVGWFVEICDGPCWKYISRVRINSSLVHGGLLGAISYPHASNPYILAIVV